MTARHERGARRTFILVVEDEHAFCFRLRDPDRLHGDITEIEEPEIDPYGDYLLVSTGPAKVVRMRFAVDAAGYDARGSTPTDDWASTLIDIADRLDRFILKPGHEHDG